MERIYKHVENVLKQVDKNNKFKDIQYQRYKEDVPNSVGIILIDSRNDTLDLSGETEYEAIKVEVHIVCENLEKEIFENMALLRKFVDAIEELDTSDDETLDLISCEHLGSKAKPSYLNGYGLQVVKCTLDINFSLV